MNKVILIGRLTANIELKRNGDGNAYTFFTLAVNDRKKGEATFISCSAWNKTAELMEQYLSKGSQIGAEGSINVFGGEKQNDGTYSQSRTFINVHSITFLDSKTEGQGSSQPISQQQSEVGEPIQDNSPQQFQDNNETIPNVKLEEIKF